MKFEEKRKDLVRGFLNAYMLRKELASASKEEVEDGRDWSTPGETIQPDAYSAEPLEEGQIRVLSGTDRLTYVALLRRWENDAFLVVPFSHYSLPATDEELKLTVDGGLFLRVLQIWNVRTLQDETLKKSWLVGDMLEQDRRDALSLLSWSWGGKAVSEDVLARTGVPIYHDGDPRLIYKQEELANFAKVDSADAAIAGIEPEEMIEEDESALPTVKSPMFKELGAAIDAWKLQWMPSQAYSASAFCCNSITAGQTFKSLAASLAPRTFRRQFQVEGVDCTILFAFHSGSSEMTAKVLDESQQASSELDGWEIRQGKEVLLGCFEGGQLRFHYDKACTDPLVLVDLDGKEAKLVEVGEEDC